MVKVELRLVLLLGSVMGVLLIAGLRWDPQRPLPRLCTRSLCGLAGVILWNALLPAATVGVNLLSAAATGWMGWPGLLLMLLLRQA